MHKDIINESEFPVELKIAREIVFVIMKKATLVEYLEPFKLSTKIGSGNNIEFSEDDLNDMLEFLQKKDFLKIWDKDKNNVFKICIHEHKLQELDKLLKNIENLLLQDTFLADNDQADVALIVHICCNHYLDENKLDDRVGFFKIEYFSNETLKRWGFKSYRQFTLSLDRLNSNGLVNLAKLPEKGEWAVSILDHKNLTDHRNFLERKIYLNNHENEAT